MGLALVLLGLAWIIYRLEGVMGDLTDLNAKLDALQAISDRIKATLEKLIGAIKTGDQAEIDAATAKADAVLTELTTAENAADPPTNS